MTPHGSSDTTVLTPEELADLCAHALEAEGAHAATARSLALATVAAEQRGRTEVGAVHLLDYLAALRAGRLDGQARPRVVDARAGALSVDAASGTAQAAFDLACDDLGRRARDCGIAVLSIHTCFTAGEIGHYTTRVAEQGLIAIAGSNSPALMSAFGAKEPVTGTNPLSFALPHPDGPRMFDQAASATAWVNIREAADRGEPIPDGWALDPQGESTTDAAEGLAGALLPFGGAKAGNIAFMVELLAAMSGGSFSLDAPAFDTGDASPQVGLFVIAIDPTVFDSRFADRAEAHLRRVAAEHGADFGRRKESRTDIALPSHVYDTLTRTIAADADLSEARPEERLEEGTP